MTRNPNLNDKMDISHTLNHKDINFPNTPDSHIHLVHLVLYSFCKILNPHFKALT
jgi:hypothetical protein